MPLEQRWTLLNQSRINIQRILSRSISIIKVIRKKVMFLKHASETSIQLHKGTCWGCFIYTRCKSSLVIPGFLVSFISVQVAKKFCVLISFRFQEIKIFFCFSLKVWEQNQIIGFFLLYEFLSLPTNLYSGNDCQLFFLFDCFYLDLRLICGDFYNVGLIK